MNGIGMGAIISGFLSGWDKQKDINFRDDERKHAQERRAVEEGRQDVQWQQGQDDRTRRVGREDTLWGRDDTTWQQGQDDRTHALERRPVVEAQQDQAFGLGVAKTKQDMQLAGNRDRRESAESAQRQRLGAMQAQLAEWGLDDKRLARSYEAAERAMVPALQQYAVDRDPRIFLPIVNEHMPPEAQVSVEPAEGGKWTLRHRGGEQVMSGDELAKMARTFVRPDVFLETMHAAEQAKREADLARAKNPKNFVEPVQGDGGAVGVLDLTSGQVTPATKPDGGPFTGMVKGAGAGNRPALLQEVDALLQNMQPRDGESGAERWMRAYGLATQRTQTAPEQAAREFYRATLTKLLPDSQYGGASQADIDKAQSLAATLTQRFAEQYLSGTAGEQPTRRPSESGTSIPPAAITYLRKNPGMRAAFDAKYGRGAAASVLGN